MKIIDLRSDTVTKPTRLMREAIFKADVGDDSYGEDPTINELEELGAEMLGKEAALFVTSGTLGNLLGVLSQTERGNEIILPNDSHMALRENVSLTTFAGVPLQLIENNKGRMNISKLNHEIHVTDDLRRTKTGLLCVENTHAYSGGSILSVDYMKSLCKLSIDKNIPIHLDGSRIFNAAVGLDTNVKKIAHYADTVQFCLSKGLGSPIGSLLCGTKTTIKKARRWRKMLGGNMRQSGIAGAAGIIALKKMTERLQEDHNKAQILAKNIANIKGLVVLNEDVQSNIILVSIKDLNTNSIDVFEYLKKRGILVGKFNHDTIRLVTHFDISNEEIERVKRSLYDLSMQIN